MSSHRTASAPCKCGGTGIEADPTTSDCIPQVAPGWHEVTVCKTCVRDLSPVALAHQRYTRVTTLECTRGETHVIVETASALPRPGNVARARLMSAAIDMALEELVKAGLIRDSGRRRNGQIVYEGTTPRAPFPRVRKVDLSVAPPITGPCTRCAGHGLVDPSGPTCFPPEQIPAGWHEVGICQTCNPVSDLGDKIALRWYGHARTECCAKGDEHVIVETASRLKLH